MFANVHCINYKTYIILEDESKYYFGLCEKGKFKLCHNNHLKTFRNNKYEVATELSLEVYLEVGGQRYILNQNNINQILGNVICA